MEWHRAFAKTQNWGMIRAAAMQGFFVIVAGLLIGPICRAQEAPGRVFRSEAAVSWLGVTPGGNVVTNSNRVDFVSDLGIDRKQSQVGLRFLVKPWRRNAIFAEFIPYRFDGAQTITRSFRFGGVTYAGNEPITAKAALNFVSLGYQYDILNRSRLEVGLVAAVAYIGVRARASSNSAGSAEVNRDIPFPLAGFAARYSPAARPRLSIRGSIRGMTFGSYGRYIDGGGAFGFDLTQHVAVEAGYQVVDGVGHHATRGAEINFRGPSITLRLHDK